MRILITSGGTKVPIDRVRDITNMSSGTFGARIAHEALVANDDVCFFCAKGSRTPMTCTIDPYRDHHALTMASNTIDFYNKHAGRYREVHFRNFDDYFHGLGRTIELYAPHAIILAAAVSDYGVANFVDGKIRSSENEQILLKPYPKVVGHIKEWHPTCTLVGFKLLVEASEDELVAAARKSIVENGCDLVVANDLTSLKKDDHTVLLVTANTVSKYSKSQVPHDQYYLARTVIRAMKEICNA